jgi:hypothetical protein
VSWAAHDLEPYVFQKHFGRRIAFVPLLVGSYGPDLASKWFVYGITIFGVRLKAENPAQFHRGWPGVGFTHSLAFGVAVALAIYAISHRSIIAWSFLVGQWAHALTDTGDTVGTMLFFPFTTHLFSIGAWAYAGQTGRFMDAGAYYSGLGFVWDGVWIVLALLSWRVLTRGYFLSTVAQADPFWGWAGRRLPETALLALYRAAFFYGVCRWSAWLIWAHGVRGYSFDLSWGGPHWVPTEHSSQLNAAGASPWVTACGAAVLAVLAALALVRRSGASRSKAHDEPALVGAEPGRRAGSGILARMIHLRGGRNRDVNARVGERPLEERLGPALDPEGLE